MTITLTPDIEQALTEEAQETGKPLEQLAVERLRATLKQTPSSHGNREIDERRANVKAARGKFAHVSGGSYAFMRRKFYEKLLEEKPHW